MFFGVLAGSSQANELASVFSQDTVGTAYEPSMASLDGWTAGGDWAVDATPAMVVDQTLDTLYATQLIPNHAQGARNPVPFVEGSSLYLLHDTGDGTNGWRQQLRKSTDGGKTWTELTNLPGYERPTGGNWGAVAVGWIEKRGNWYYLHRVTTDNTETGDNQGLPAAPYNWDIWKTQDIEGTWTAVREVALDDDSWAAYTKLPGCTVYSGSEYIHFTQGGSTVDGLFRVGISRASTPDGAFDADAAPLFVQEDFWQTKQPENPRVFYHPPSAKWVMLTNLINSAGTFTDTNVAILSDSLEDWSSATIGYIQWRSPIDGSYETAIGTVAHFHGPDDSLIYDSTSGDVPILFDSFPEGVAPGWHMQRKIKPAILRYSDAGLTSTTTGSITRSHTHDDFAAYFVASFGNATVDTNVGFWFRQTGGDGNNGYRLVVRNEQRLLLQKYVAGSPTNIEVAASGGTVAGIFDNRIKVVCSGTSIKAWLNGELQINTSDSEFSSGDTIGFYNFDASVTVRKLRMYATAEVSISGLPAHAVVTLRSAGSLFAGEYVADASGDLTIPTDGPYTALECRGTRQTLSVVPGGSYVFAGSSTGFPSIDAQPISVTVNSGEDATFTASITGFVSGRWQKKINSCWGDIPDETSTSLTLSVVTTDDSGTQYRLIASGSAGDVGTDTVTLTVTDTAPGRLGSAALFLSALSGVWQDNSYPPATPAGVGDPVGVWVDRNANGEYVVASSGNEGTLASGPTVSCEGGALITNGSFAGLASKTSFTIFFRCTIADTIANQAIFSCGNGILAQVFSGELYVYANSGNSGKVAIASGADALYRLEYDGSQPDNASRLKLFVDGVEKTLTFSGAIPASTEAATGITVGAHTTGIIPFSGSIKYLAVINGGALSAPELAEAEAYLTP